MLLFVTPVRMSISSPWPVCSGSIAQIPPKLLFSWKQGREKGEEVKERYTIDFKFFYSKQLLRRIS